MLDAVKLALSAMQGGIRLGTDAWGDIWGASLPYKPLDVIRPETLTRLLNNGAVHPAAASAKIITVTVQDIPSISSNCQNLILSIEQSGEATLPESLFVKVPMESFATRWFFSVINSWQLESHFFTHVAQHIPLRTPVTYATKWEGTRFYLIQENLRDDPSVELFVNPDMQQGPSLERVYACLDAFARLHSHHYGISASERESILPLSLHPFLSKQMGTVAKNLNSLALKPCMKKRPGDIPEEVAVTYRKTMQHWDSLLQYWFSEPLSLLHGDSHIGNFFVSGDEMGMLDWQAAHWGKGIRDVQYFLIDSLPADVLAEHEQALFAYYVERCAVHGQPIDPDITWQAYRSFTFHTLMTIVVSVGFGALNEEQDSLMVKMLARAVAAVQRVQYADWLEEFLEHGKTL